MPDMDILSAMFVYVDQLSARLSQLLRKPQALNKIIGSVRYMFDLLRFPTGRHNSTHQESSSGIFEVETMVADDIIWLFFAWYPQVPAIHFYRELLRRGQDRPRR